MITTRPSLLKRIWSRRWRFSLACFLLLFLMMNVVAYFHAYAFTHFTQTGQQTKPPDKLTFSEKLAVLARGAVIKKPPIRRTPKDVGFDFYTHQFQADDGVNLEAWYVPAPRPRGLIALFPGYSMSKSSLVQELKILRELSYSCLLVDFRGAGGSDGYETTIGFREAADVAASVRLASRLEPNSRLALIGISMGSAAILRSIACCDVSVDAIVLQSPFDRLLTTTSHRFTTMKVPSFPMAQMLVFWGGVQMGFDGFALNPVEFATHVECPALVIHGGNDPWITEKESASIYDQLRGPRHFEVFAGVAHESFAGKNPAHWKKVVGDFLQKNLGPKQIAVRQLSIP